MQCAKVGPQLERRVVCQLPSRILVEAFWFPCKSTQPAPSSLSCGLATLTASNGKQVAQWRSVVRSALDPGRCAARDNKRQPSAPGELRSCPFSSHSNLISDVRLPLLALAPPLFSAHLAYSRLQDADQGYRHPLRPRGLCEHRGCPRRTWLLGSRHLRDCHHGLGLQLLGLSFQLDDQVFLRRKLYLWLQRHCHRQLNQAV